MSSTPTDRPAASVAAANRAWPAARMAGDRPGSGRALTKRTSTASDPDHTNTARSATPARRAAASEQTTRAADWSDPRKAVIRLVYGSHTIRLSGEGVAISPAVRRWGNHAYGWAAATSVNGAISSPITVRCAGAFRPARAANTFSNSGYTWIGASRAG